MSRKIATKLIPLGILGVLVVAVVFGVWATHGFLWSVYIPIYDRLLYDVPSPPGLVTETDEVDLNPETPWGYRTYRVDGDHLEIVDFFTTHFPGAGWDARENDSWRTEREPSGHLQVDHMLFVTQDPYWLRKYWIIVYVYTDVDEEGVRVGDSLVTLEIHRDEEVALSRYRP